MGLDIARTECLHCVPDGVGYQYLSHAAGEVVMELAIALERMHAVCCCWSRLAVWSASRRKGWAGSF